MTQLEQAAAYAQQYQNQAGAQQYNDQPTSDGTSGTNSNNDDVIDADFSEKK